MIKARISNFDDWSPLVEARFVVDRSAPSPDGLTLSQVHYRPARPSEEESAAGYGSRGDFEFLQLTNISESTIDLTTLRFNDGVTFRFDEAAIDHLEPGSSLFIVKNEAAFAMRYGDDLPVAGSFTGSLSNDGERLRLVNDDATVIQELTYNDVEPWPLEADGEGSFLVLRTTEKAEPSNPDQWRASLEDEMPGDSSGAPTPPTSPAYDEWAQIYFSNEDDALPHNDLDDDGFANILEFIFDTNPTLTTSSPKIEVHRDQLDWRLSTVQLPDSGHELTLEHSSDLENWETVASVEVTRESIPALPSKDRVDYRWSQSESISANYFRLRADAP